MSNDTGDSSSRSSNALDEIFSDSRHADDPAGSPSDALDDTQPYELPQIVPATAEPTVETNTVATPRLPDRPIVPEPAAAERPAARTEPPAEARSPAPPESPASSVRNAAPVTGWSDHMPTQTSPAASQLRTPGRRPRVRRVTRVVRHVDPWSTFKVALLLNAVAYVVGLTSGVLLWRVADSTGTLDNVERWFTQFGWETFELDGGEIFHNAWIIGLFAVVAATGAAVLLITVFNLVSDIVGGVRMTVLEEEVVERTISSTRRYVVRRPADAGASAAASVWSADDLDDADDDVDTDGDVVAATEVDASSNSASNGQHAGDDRGADSQAATKPAPATEPASAPTADWSVD